MPCACNDAALGSVGAVGMGRFGTREAFASDWVRSSKAAVDSESCGDDVEATTGGCTGGGAVATVVGAAAGGGVAIAGGATGAGAAAVGGVEATGAVAAVGELAVGAPSERWLCHHAPPSTSTAAASKPITSSAQPGNSRRAVASGTCDKPGTAER